MGLIEYSLSAASTAKGLLLRDAHQERRKSTRQQPVTVPCLEMRLLFRPVQSPLSNHGGFVPGAPRIQKSTDAQVL